MLIELHRKPTVVKGSSQVSRMQISLQKRGKKFSQEVEGHWQEGSSR